MLKIFPSDKINDTENAVFFLSRALARHNFTFFLLFNFTILQFYNLRFLYELKHKVRLSKTVCVVLHF